MDPAICQADWRSLFGLCKPGGGLRHPQPVATTLDAALKSSESPSAATLDAGRAAALHAVTTALDTGTAAALHSGTAAALHAVTTALDTGRAATLHSGRAATLHSGRAAALDSPSADTQRPDTLNAEATRTVHRAECGATSRRARGVAGSSCNGCHKRCDDN